VTVPIDPDALREQVRERYAAAATTSCCRSDADICCGSELINEQQRAWFGESPYDQSDRDALPDSAVLASLWGGNPPAIAELHQGETVLDLGPGGGIDVLLSARRVGPTGLAYGLDMTG
jgi:arsenite methyltransferase